MAKDIHQWFNKYSESHQNQTNKRIHFICVPLIYISIIGMLSYIRLTPSIDAKPNLFPYFNMGELLILIALIFYIRISIPIFIGMALLSTGCYMLLRYGILHSNFPVWIICGITFIIAWLGQFYGHKIEGKKPSFLTDLLFLLIGPAWILGFIYRKLGIKY
jgi:uncharacterized membrane protein YGL010W